MMLLIQQLGRLDARLIHADETWPDVSLQISFLTQTVQPFTST